MLVLLVLTGPAVLFALGIGTFLLPFWAIGYGSGFGRLTIFLVVSGSIIGAIVGTLIGRYLLFQSRPLYRN